MTFDPVSLNRVAEVVRSYMVQRDALVSGLRETYPSHMRFAHFVNAQSTLLNQALGMLNGADLKTVLAFVVNAPMKPVLATEKQDEALMELLGVQIAYLEMVEKNKASK